jgi:hypothetical protein
MYTATYYTTTDIEDNNSDADFVIYPNPTRDFIKISDLRGTFSYSLTDMSGKTVKAGIVSETDNQVNISELEKGLYLIKITGNNFNFTRKVLLR